MDKFTEFLLAHPIALATFFVIAGAIFIIDKVKFFLQRARDAWRWLSNHAGPR